MNTPLRADRWVLRVGLIASAAILAVGSGCGRGTQGHGESVATLKQAATVAPVSQYFILATNSCSLQSNVSESGGGIGVSAGTGLLPNSLTVGLNGRVAVSSVLAAPLVLLGVGTVAGNVVTSQLIAPFTTTGAVSPFAAPPAAPVPGPVSAGTTAINVPLFQTAALTSGQYGAVTVLGTLNLQGGIYQFASLTLGLGARLTALGSSVVRSAGVVSALPGAQLAPAAPLHAPDLRLEVSGTDALGNSVVLGNNVQMTALADAKGAFTAGDWFVGKGAIAGTQVSIGNNAQLTFDTGFACTTNSDCVQGACVAGSCVDNSTGFACQATSVSRVPVNPTQPYDLATDGTLLYWTDTATGSVASSAFDGTSQTTIVSGVPGIGGLAVDSTSVYFSDTGGGTVSSVPISGGTPTVIAADQREPRELASNGDQLVWTNQGTGTTNGSVREYTKSTGVLNAIADRQPGPWSISPIGGGFYWSDVVSGTVLFSSQVNSSSQTIATGLVNPAMATSGAQQPYFLSGDGRILVFDTTAQQVVQRAVTSPGAFSLAANEPSLFWTNGLAETVSQQLTKTEFPSTLWRRPGTGSPRVIRLLGNRVGFTAAASSGASSIFIFTPGSAAAIAPDLPNCIPGGQGAACDSASSAITPVLECVTPTTNNGLIAHFGYTNADSVPRRVGVGSENHVDRLDGDACLPTTFAPGTNHDIVAVAFVDEVTWIVGTHSVTASRSSPQCTAGTVKNTEVSP